MDQNIKKTVLRQITYGLYILTVKNNDQYSAATITWLSQASFTPLLLMLGVKKENNTYDNLSLVKQFAVNILGESQKKMAVAFFKDTVVEENMLNGYMFKTEQTGAPIFIDTPLYLECIVQKIIDGSDHNIIIAEIINTGLNNEKSPLTLKSTGWNYGG